MPPRYATDDHDLMIALIRDNGFAVLVTRDADDATGMSANHLPLEWDPDGGPEGRLLGHMAAGNMQWQAFDGNTPALAVFQGPHAYLSPRWYVSRDVVPTWNYAAVHVTGRPRVIGDAEQSSSVIASLVSHYEGPDGWSMDGMGAEFREMMLKGIVAFEMPIERIEGKQKMSQNRTPEDVAAAVAELRALGGDQSLAVAEIMERCNVGE